MQVEIDGGELTGLCPTYETLVRKRGVMVDWRMGLKALAGFLGQKWKL
jgi:hypothetical protein